MALQQQPKLIGEDLYGRVVYLLGGSELGVKNKPTRIDNIQELYKNFGRKGSLIEGYKQVKEGSEEAIVYLCKATGEHATVKLNVNVPNQEKPKKDAIVFLSAHAHERYNDISILLTPNYLTFSFPPEFNTRSVSYYYQDYPTLSDLMNKINKDTERGRNHVYMQCFSDLNLRTSTAIHTVNPMEVQFYGGDSGLNWNKNKLYYALKTTYTLLAGDDIDRIVPLEAFVDSISLSSDFASASSRDKLTAEDEYGYLSFYRQLLEFCINQMQYGLITRGIMGYCTTSDKYLQDDFDGYVAYAKACLMENLVKANDLRDYYGLIDVCVGDVYYDYGSSLGNHYTAYAGLSSGLPLKDHTTNKAYSRSIVLRNEFQNEHFLDFMDNSLVGVRTSPLTDLVTIVNGVTTAPRDSDMHYACNVNMLQVTAYYVQKMFNRYLGENLSALLKNNTLKKELEEVLKYLKEKGIIEQYKAQILENEREGKITYNISLKSRNMINYIGLSNSINYIRG